MFILNIYQIKCNFVILVFGFCKINILLRLARCFMKMKSTKRASLNDHLNVSLVFDYVALRIPIVFKPCLDNIINKIC